MNLKSIRRIAAFVLYVLILISTFVGTSFSAFAKSFEVVTTDAVRLRSTPEITDGNTITTLNISETLTLLEESTDNWAKVSRSDGTVGYCYVDYLDVAEGSSVEFTGVTTAEVNFRSGPSTDYQSYAVLDQGQLFKVLDNSSDYWIKAEVNEQEGYIYRSYTELKLSFGSSSDDNDDSHISTPDASVPDTVPEIPVTTFLQAEDTTCQEITTIVAVEPQETTALIEAETTEPTVSVGVSKPAQPVNTPNWYSSSLLGSGDVSDRAPLRGEFVLNLSKINLNAGESENLSVLSLGGSVNSSVSFESSDTGIATVSPSGLVFARSEGSALITASFGSYSSTCMVNVTGTYTPSEPETEPDTTPDVTEPQASEPAESIPVATVPDTSAPSDTAPTTDPNVFELSASSAKIEAGNMFVLTSPFENSEWSSSNTKVATVENGFVIALTEGTADIKAFADGKTGTCKLTVTKVSEGLSIEYSEVELSKGKTFYNGAASSAQISWSSSDTAVAKVSNGFITAVSEGRAVITASSSKGAKTCLVEVVKAEPLRFSYAYPNTVAKNEKLSLVAITDKERTGVQFKIDVNGTTLTVDATNNKIDGNTIVWTGETTIASAGEFDVTAYSKVGNKYTTCSQGEFSVFVRETKDTAKETTEKRRVSDEGIALIAGFEGYVGNVYFDTLAGGIPTLGYGKVIYIGDEFYNDMTKTEALAQLYDTVNNGGYSSNVNSYLGTLKANYNQHQFDALVSFAYNIGYYGLKSDSEIRALILNSTEKIPQENVDKNAAYVNSTNVNLRKGAGTSFESLGLVNFPDTLTLLDTKLVNKSWYHIKTADGTEGYIYKDYVTLGAPEAEGDVYLSLIDKAEFTRVILEYHHAGSNCYYGLLYRRVDELELFYSGDYLRNGDSNKMGFTFACDKDKSFKL